MQVSMDIKSIYIVISQTGTVLSRILKVITHKEYNHVSIGLEENLKIMYSFGRKNPYNPFYGGFVKESASFGTFKRFSNTRVLVLKLDIEKDTYFELQNFIENMLETSKKYKYNYIGLCLAAFKINVTRQDRYYCSEFVRDLLVRFKIVSEDKLKKIIHPMNFLDIPNTYTVYSGKLSEYSI